MSVRSEVFASRLDQERLCYFPDPCCHRQQTPTSQSSGWYRGFVAAHVTIPIRRMVDWGEWDHVLCGQVPAAPPIR